MKATNVLHDAIDDRGKKHYFDCRRVRVCSGLAVLVMVCAVCGFNSLQADFLTTMEQFVGAPPTKQQQPIRSAPAPAPAAAAAAAPPSPPVLGTIQTQQAPDLLAFDDLTISAPAPAVAVVRE